MFQRLDNRFGHYLLLIATGTSLFLVNLGGPALWDLDEGRNAVAAMEMRESGNWVVPRFNGDLRAHKPALLYWLQVLAFDAFGVNEFAARLPSALAGLITVLLVYELGRRMFSPRAGLLAGIILASTALFCAAAHFANPDALLVAFTTAALLCFWLGLKGSKRIWFSAVGAAMGLAMLAKGPVGLVLPAAAIFVFLVWSRRWRLLIHPVWLLAIVTFSLVALPWYVLVSLDTNRIFLTEFFMRHNLDRALKPMEGHGGPPWYYVAVLLVGLTPWSAFLGSAVWYGGRAVRRKRSETEEPDSSAHAYRLLWCWIAVFLAAFTLAATKLPNYILPVFPSFALLIADFLERWRRGAVHVPPWIQFTSVGVLGLVGVAITIGLLMGSGAAPGLQHWSALGVILIAGAFVAYWCLRTERRSAFVAVVSCSSIVFLAAAAAGGCTVFDAMRAPRPLVAQAGALQREQDIRIACFRLEHLPSLNFYVQRDVKHYQVEREAIDSLRNDLHVFLFLPKSEWERLAPDVTTPHRVLGTHRDMYRAGEVVVVTNR